MWCSELFRAFNLGEWSRRGRRREGEGAKGKEGSSGPAGFEPRPLESKPVVLSIGRCESKRALETIASTKDLPPHDNNKKKKGQKTYFAQWLRQRTLNHKSRARNLPCNDLNLGIQAPSVLPHHKILLLFHCNKNAQGV